MEDVTPALVRGHFTLPIYIDLGATFLYGLTGALIAIRRRYDMVGLFVLALVTGLGGSLIRDGLFIQAGPPVVMQDPRYLFAILAGCLAVPLFGHRVQRLQNVFVVADALGLGAYAVVGVQRSLNAGLSIIVAIVVGVVNAVGGGLLRDVLVREEPLMFKPGQFYVMAAVLGSCLFCLLIFRWDKPPETAALLSIGCTFVFRGLAIIYDWKTVSIAQRAASTVTDTSMMNSTTVSTSVSSSPVASEENTRSQSDSPPAPPPPTEPSR